MSATVEKACPKCGRVYRRRYGAYCGMRQRDSAVACVDYYLKVHDRIAHTESEPRPPEVPVKGAASGVPPAAEPPASTNPREGA